MMFLIYKYTSPSGKSYIGQTNNIKEREKLHKRSSSCPAFSRAIKKYGFDNFKREILCSDLSIEEANKMEALLIKEHNTMYPLGYNLRSGGDNSTLSDLSRKRLSAARKGIVFSDEHLKNLSVSHKGNKQSEESKKKISQGLKGRVVSEETKEKLRKANSGKKLTDAQKENLRKINLGKKYSPRTQEQKERTSAAIKLHWEKRKAKGSDGECPV